MFTLNGTVHLAYILKLFFRFIGSLLKVIFWMLSGWSLCDSNDELEIVEDSDWDEDEDEDDDANLDELGDEVEVEEETDHDLNPKSCCLLSFVLPLARFSLGLKTFFFIRDLGFKSWSVSSSSSV